MYIIGAAEAGRFRAIPKQRSFSEVNSAVLPLFPKIDMVVKTRRYVRTLFAAVDTQQQESLLGLQIGVFLEAAEI